MKSFTVFLTFLSALARSSIVAAVKLVEAKITVQASIFFVPDLTNTSPKNGTGRGLANDFVEVFPSFPLHTQSVERAVKLVTEAASHVCGEEKRHGYILSVIESRRIRKPFDTKLDYNVNL